MDYFKDWAVSCRRELEDNVMPFWLRHGWDRVNGGVYTCLDRDGSLMDSTKSGWFQGRFAFTCAYAANVLGAGEEYIAAARSTLDFIDAHLFDSRGRAYFALAADGTPLRMRRYLFSEISRRSPFLNTTRIEDGISMPSALNTGFAPSLSTLSTTPFISRISNTCAMLSIFMSSRRDEVRPPAVNE